MALHRGLVVVWGVIGLAAGAAGSDAGQGLREAWQAGDGSRVVVELKAEGLYRPGPPPGAGQARAKAKDEARPLALRVETRLEFVERVVELEPKGGVRRTVRRVVQAGSAINGEVRPRSSVLRPEVALLVAERRGDAVVVWSAGGPLTRAELELVQGAGDPMALGGLLPSAPVKPGQTWKVDETSARALSAYDHLTDNAVKATLKSLDDATAQVGLSGEVRGTVLGAEGRMLLEGSFTFDRKANRIERLTLRRSEARRPGAVEAGLDVKSTLTVRRDPLDAPGELTDELVASVPSGSDPQREQLLLISRDGKYTLRHDRDWHTYWDDIRLTVLKRLDRGTVVAQCNLMTGPHAGKGRHQDLEQFRGDIRRALGSRFVGFQGDGEVEGAPAGGFRYKVGVQGREGELGVLWYYYLVASPEGDQLLATFTLAEDHARAFGGQDLLLIGSLEWKNQPEPAAGP